jgi:hypothetical protein
MGRDLHRHVVDAGVDAAREDPVEAEHVRGGAIGGSQVVQRAITQGADQAGRAMGPVPGLRQEMGDRGLAVGAGDRGNGHQVRRRGPEARGEFAQAPGQPGQFDRRHVQGGVAAPPVVDHRHAAPGERFLGMRHAVPAQALDSHERVPGSDRARILAEAGDDDIRAPFQPPFQQCREAHPVGHWPPPGSCVPDCTISAE